MFVSFSLRLYEETLFIRIRKQRKNICINKTDAVRIEKLWLLLSPQKQFLTFLHHISEASFVTIKPAARQEIESYDSSSNLNLSQCICSKQMFMWQISEESESRAIYNGNWDLGHLFDLTNSIYAWLIYSSIVLHFCTLLQDLIKRHIRFNGFILASQYTFQAKVRCTNCIVQLNSQTTHINEQGKRSKYIINFWPKSCLCCGTSANMPLFAMSFILMVTGHG